MSEQGVTSYPVNHVIGVVDGPEEVEAISEELATAGRDDDLKVLGGPSGLARLDARGERGGLLHRIGRRMLRFGEERDHLDAIAEELAAGHLAVAVAVADEQGKQEVATLLRRHRTRHLRFYGRATFEDLPTE